MTNKEILERMGIKTMSSHSLSKLKIKKKSKTVDCQETEAYDADDFDDPEAYDADDFVDPEVIEEVENEYQQDELANNNQQRHSSSPSRYNPVVNDAMNYNSVGVYNPGVSTNSMSVPQPQRYKTCPSCKGTRSRVENRPLSVAHLGQPCTHARVICPQCNFSYKECDTYHTHKTCGVCNGAGQVVDYSH